MRRTTTKNLKNSFVKIFIFGLLFSVFALPMGEISPAKAADAVASLYFAPSSGTKVLGSQFSVSIKVDSGGQAVNSADGSISYDGGLLDLVSVSTGGSAFNLWITDPSLPASRSAGSIKFGGGLPNPGYTGSAGHIFSATFRAKKIGTAQIRFTSGGVLANDGKGTNILKFMGSASFIISPQAEAPKPDTGPSRPGEPVQQAEPEYNKPEIVSPTHPEQEQWYNINDVKFSWSLPEGVNGVSLSFDREAGSDPGSLSDGLLSEKEYSGAEDGISYFHLKYKDSRRWGTAAHYKVMIDTQAPKDFEIKVQEAEPGDIPELRFKAEDELSGIKHYEIIIDNLESEAVIVPAEQNTFKPENIGAGEHTALIKAVDKAGNSTYSQAKFSVPEIEAPKITDYPKEIRAGDKFFVSGTALPNVTVNVYIDSESGNIIQESASSDNAGNWFYINPQNLENGRYVAWAEAINDKGIKSGPSNKVSFLVTPPVFAQIGSFVINYFTVLVSLLFLILLIIALILFIIWLIRRKLKKETVEVEQILKSNAAEMKASIESEFKQIGTQPTKTAINQEKEAAKKRLIQKLDDNTKKTLKEIRDVEELLK